MNNLVGKTILGFVQLIIGLGILLLAPAWTLRFWQAWVYLFVFAASSALITAHLWKKDRKLLEQRVNAGPAAEKERKQQIIQLVPSAAFLARILLPPTAPRFACPPLPFPPPF